MKYHFQRSRFGNTFIRLLVPYSTCILRELCIEIWSQRTFSSMEKAIWKSVIWGWVGSWVHKLLKHFQELEHRCIWVPKYYRVKVMIGNQMYGVWDVSLMSLQLWEVRLDNQIKRTWIFMSCSNEFLKVIFPRLQRDIRKNYEVLLSVCWKWILIRDLISTKFVSFVRRIKSIWQTNLKSIRIWSWTT